MKELNEFLNIQKPASIQNTIEANQVYRLPFNETFYNIFNDYYYTTQNNEYIENVIAFDEYSRNHVMRIDMRPQRWYLQLDNLNQRLIKLGGKLELLEKDLIGINKRLESFDIDTKYTFDDDDTDTKNRNSAYNRLMKIYQKVTRNIDEVKYTKKLVEADKLAILNNLSLNGYTCVEATDNPSTSDKIINYKIYRLQGNKYKSELKFVPVLTSEEIKNSISFSEDWKENVTKLKNKLSFEPKSPLRQPALKLEFENEELELTTLAMCSKIQSYKRIPKKPWSIEYIKKEEDRINLIMNIKSKFKEIQEFDNQIISASNDEVRNEFEKNKKEAETEKAKLVTNLSFKDMCAYPPEAVKIFYDLRLNFLLRWNDKAIYDNIIGLDEIQRNSNPLSELTDQIRVFSHGRKYFSIQKFFYVSGEFYNEDDQSLREFMELPNLDDKVILLPYLDRFGQISDEIFFAVFGPRKPSNLLQPKLPVIKLVESHQLNLSWKGYAIGPLSSTFNLFPGEEKELIIERKTKITRSSSQSARQGEEQQRHNTSSFEDNLHNELSMSANVNVSSEKTQQRNTASTSNTKSDSQQSNEASSLQSRENSAKSNLKAGASGGWGSFGFSVEKNLSESSTYNQQSAQSRKSAQSSSKGLTLAISSNEQGVALDKHSRDTFQKNLKNTIAKVASETSINNRLEITTASSEQEEESNENKEIMRLKNPNLGCTVNYNFFQLQNIYDIKTELSDLKIVLDTGYRIVEGTQIRDIRIYDIEEFNKIYKSTNQSAISTFLCAIIIKRIMKYYSNVPNKENDGFLKVFCKNTNNKIEVVAVHEIYQEISALISSKVTKEKSININTSFKKLYSLNFLNIEENALGYESVQQIVSTARNYNIIKNLTLEAQQNAPRKRLHNEETVKQKLASRIPNHFQLGAAIGQGDSFFDAMAQSLNVLKGSNDYTAKMLRLLCRDYVKSGKHTWVKENIEAKGDNYEQYLDRIPFTVGEEEKDKIGFKLENIVLGRPKIEGRMICEIFKVKLHVIGVPEEQPNGGIDVTEQLGNAQGFEPIATLEKGQYNGSDVVHLVNYQDHFVPLLNNKILSDASKALEGKISSLRNSIQRLSHYTFKLNVNNDVLKQEKLIVNAPAYHVDSQPGIICAIEPYLENRRNTELQAQNAEVELRRAEVTRENALTTYLSSISTQSLSNHNITLFGNNRRKNSNEKSDMQIEIVDPNHRRMPSQ